MNAKQAIFAALLAALAAGSAQAGTIDVNYNFSLTGFTDVSGAALTSPVSQIIGVIHCNF